MQTPLSYSEFNQEHPKRKLGFKARFKRILLAGLLTLAPVAITVYALIWLFHLIDGVFAPLVTQLEQFFGVPLVGLGLVMTLLAVLLLGWLSTNVVGRRLLFFLEQIIHRIPVAKSIYSGTKGILETVSRDQTEAFKRVVLIEYPKARVHAIAFVTGSARWGHIHDNLEDFVLVFVPTTPNPTSGFLLMVPREETVNLPITVEEGIRLVISGGILLPKMTGPPPQPPLAAVPPAAEG
jgi:uncharacterized membrane protein